MNKREPMKINISSSFYNNLTSKDGIHYEEVLEDKPYYTVRMGKSYFDVKDKQELLRLIIEDLEEVINTLEKELNQEKEEER